jgi:hypothetical protein
MLSLAAASDKVYQLLVHGRWFSPGTPAINFEDFLIHIVLYIKFEAFNINRYKATFVVP